MVVLKSINQLIEVEPNEGRCDARHDRASLHDRVVVVKDVSHNSRVRSDAARCSGCWNSKSVHRLKHPIKYDREFRLFNNLQNLVTSLHRNSLIEDRRTFRPSALREYGV